MVIIGITGTLGAGKGEVVAYLKSKGFEHFSAREFLKEEYRKTGELADRQKMTDFADSLRKNHSPSYIIEALYARAVEYGTTNPGSNAILESVRASGEVDFLKSQEEQHFYLIAVDADPKIRYERIVKRKSELDHVSFERFILDEDREMRSTDPNKGNISECIRRADVVFINNSNLADLHAQIEKFLPKILQK